ncbi:flavanone 3-dioxygenase 3-like [Andrographis paniculata]|uniref:flavanone 3-dioxygenase 3-like n=1 Tax=Andrographis paniculata TaxID=175694 RepID=UPI0021E711AB|nr:flavanone 3-dioxygenase 3-like [Andrographis paniculata]
MLSEQEMFFREKAADDFTVSTHPKMDRKNASSSSGAGASPIGETPQEKGLPYLPGCYKVRSSDMPEKASKAVEFPLVDLAGMNDPARRKTLVEEIGSACFRNGFFHVVNHGISQAAMDGALAAASAFFDLPTKCKSPFMSNDVHKPVRYCTSLKDGIDTVQYWRAFLKHYAHPLDRWIEMWPLQPPDYREKMGGYVEAMQKLAETITELITESLGLGPKYLTAKLDEGMQVVTVNCYPACPQPELALGLPLHSDYGCVTIVLQDSPGLQILDRDDDDSWRVVPSIPGALHVQVGDQIEVLSNGRYKSVLHRVAVNHEKTRISIAGLHGLRMDVKMEAAAEMVDGDRPNGYNASSFRDFLDFIAENDIAQGRRFMDNNLRLRR